MTLIEEMLIPLIWMAFGGAVLYFMLIPVIYIRDLMTATYLPNYTLFFHLYPIIYVYLPLLATIGYGSILVRLFSIAGTGCALFSSLVGLTLLLRLFLAEYEDLMRNILIVIFTLPPVLFFFSFLPVIVQGESTSLLITSLTPILPHSIMCFVLTIPVAMAIDYYRFRQMAGF